MLATQQFRTCICSIIFMLTALIFILSASEARAVICEAIKDVKPSESAANQDKVLQCIKEGLDPPMSWRVREGKGTGYMGGTAGGIMSMAKCPPDRSMPCPSYKGIRRGGGSSGNNSDEDYGIDSDGDGVPNVFDQDADGNGVPDVHQQDSDNDGIPDTVDSDDDDDGIADNEDPDMDGDGIPNELEPDTDGDGIIDDLDIDANGNGINDVEEQAGGGTTSCNGSGEKIITPEKSEAIAMPCGGGIRINYPIITIARNATYYAIPSGNAIHVYRKEGEKFILHKKLEDLPLAIDGPVPVPEDPENPTPPPPPILEGGTVEGSPEPIPTVPAPVETTTGAVVPKLANQFIGLSEDSKYLAVAYTNTPLFTIYRKSGGTFYKMTDAGVLPPDFGLIRISTTPGSLCRAFTMTAYAPCNDQFITVNRDHMTFILPPQTEPFPFMEGNSEQMLLNIPAAYTAGALVVLPLNSKLELGVGAGKFFLTNGGSYLPPGSTPDAEHVQIPKLSYVSADSANSLTITLQNGQTNTVAFRPNETVTVYVDDGSVHLPPTSLLPTKAKGLIATPTRVSVDALEPDATTSPKE